MINNIRSLSLRLLGAFLVLGILPWYAINDGFFAFSWVKAGYFTDVELAPLLLQAFTQERLWLVPIVIGLIAVMALETYKFRIPYAKTERASIYIAVLSLAWIFLQGMLVNDFGVVFIALEPIVGVRSYQEGMGFGAFLLCSYLIYIIGLNATRQGFMKGDLFSTYALLMVIFLVTVFVIFPVTNILYRAFYDVDTGFSPTLFADRFFTKQIWSLNCLITSGQCGVATSTVFLAVMTGLSTTFLGLCFALVITRTDFPLRKLFRGFSLLPIITPPFVVGMALVMLLGRSGLITKGIETVFDVELGGWIYGFWGLWIAQTLAYTPIAFMVLIGVVQGVGPSLEEASSTLSASRFRTFQKVTFPLMKPGIANAFLLGFVESMADLGNALLVGGDYPVLSAQIFYSVAGASYSLGNAAALVFSLLIFTIMAFLIQRFWLGKKSYTSVTGKGDAGRHATLPVGIRHSAIVITSIWSVLTLTIYMMILYGGFTKTFGVDYSLTFEHYIQAFKLGVVQDRLVALGVAWDSLITTLSLSAVAMPLTTIVGLATGYLLTRKVFPFKDTFEFSTMLSFAIPGIVIGFSYVVAFNQAPIDLTFTGLIIIICFVFRNMPVGVRSTIAALKQLDPGLEESALTLGAGNFKVIRTVVLPLIKPAVFSAMVYSFIRSITSVSAILFLVSADYNLASAFIIGLVEHNEFGVPIAYATTLILLMAVIILLFNLVIGKRVLYARVKN